MIMSIEWLLNAFIFMKLSVPHHLHALGFKVWNERELAPFIKYILIDIMLEVINHK